MLASVLKELLDNADYQGAPARDRFVFNLLNDHFLARHLMENDPTRDPFARNPRELYRRLNRADEEFGQSQQAITGTELLTPFDFLSCEQIGESHKLLKALYSDRRADGLSLIHSSRSLSSPPR